MHCCRQLENCVPYLHCGHLSLCTVPTLWTGGVQNTVPALWTGGAPYTVSALWTGGVPWTVPALWKLEYCELYLQCALMKYRVPYLHCGQLSAVYRACRSSVYCTCTVDCWSIVYCICKVDKLSTVYRTCTVDSWSTMYRICTVDRWSPVYCSRYLYYGQLENCWQVENCVLCTATVMYTRVSNFAP